MTRVLRPGGRVIIGDLMFENEAARGQMLERLAAMGRTDVLEEIEDEYFGTVEELVAAFSGFGHKVKWKQMAHLTFLVWTG